MKKALFVVFFLLASAFSASGQGRSYVGQPPEDVAIYLKGEVGRRYRLELQKEWIATGLLSTKAWPNTGGAMYADPRLTRGVDPRSTGGAMYLDPRLTGPAILYPNNGAAMYPGNSGTKLYWPPQKQAPSGNRRRNPPSGGFPAPSERRLRR